MAQLGGTPARQLPPNSPFGGSVPQGPPTAETVQLTVGDIIRRALEHNLGVLLSEQSLARAGGARWLALADLLPNVDARVAESRQRNNLEAFGFSGPIGMFRKYLAERCLAERGLARTSEAKRFVSIGSGNCDLEIGLGCVDVTPGRIDSAETIAGRVRQALKHLAPERITLNPDCGFAPGSGAVVSIDEAYRKLCNQSEAARILRGERSGR